MHADAKRCHGIGGPKFGIGRLREKFPVFSRKNLKVWLVPRSCQPTAPMVADPSLLQNQLITQNSRLVG